MNEKTNENWYCSSCGNFTDREKNFCVHCGIKLDKQEVDEKIHSKPQPIIVMQKRSKKHQVTPNIVRLGEPNKYAILSFVFTILGILPLPILGGLLAVILGFIGAFKPYRKKMAIISIIIGVITVSLWAIALGLFIIPFYMWWENLELPWWW